MKKVRAALGIAAGIFGVAGIAYLLSRPQDTIEQKLAPEFNGGANIEYETEQSLDYGLSLHVSEKNNQKSIPSYEPAEIKALTPIAENIIAILQEDTPFSVRVEWLTDYLMKFDISQIEKAVSEIDDPFSKVTFINELREAVPNVLNRKADEGEDFIKYTQSLMALTKYFETRGDKLDFYKKIADKVSEEFERTGDENATRILRATLERPLPQYCNVSNKNQKCTLDGEDRVRIIEAIRRGIFENNIDSIRAYEVFLNNTRDGGIRDRYASERIVLEERVAKHLRGDIYTAITKGGANVVDIAYLLTAEKISTNPYHEVWSDSSMRMGMVNFLGIPMNPSSEDFAKARELLPDVGKLPLYPKDKGKGEAFNHTDRLIQTYLRLGMVQELQLYSDRIGKELPPEIAKPLQGRINTALSGS